jgi:hypothetical protein
MSYDCWLGVAHLKGGADTMRRLLPNAVLLLGSVLFALAVCEILIRAFSDRCENELAHRKIFVEYDPLLGWRKVPNKRGKHVACEYRTDESINSKGIRGPEYSYQKQANEYRILALGDSFTEGYTVEFHELFSEILKNRLNTSREKYYEVINAGTGGYSTDQELLFFQYEGRKYKPDLTILMFYYKNDVIYNIRDRYLRGHKPLFILEDYKLKLTNVPVPIMRSQSKKAEEDIEFSQRVKLWLYENYYTYNFVVRRIKNTYYSNWLAIKLGLFEETKNEGFPVSIPDRYRIWEKTLSAEFQHAWNITERLILKLKEEVNSIGSKFFLFHIPFEASIYPEEWQVLKRKYGVSDAEWSIEQPSLILEGICKRNHIDCLIPITAFRDEAKRMKAAGKRLYFPLDGHWNAHGHKLAGDTLADYIQTNYLMLAPHR